MDSAPGRPESDAELVARFKGGDESAYDGLVARHRMAIYRIAFRLTGRHEEADDLAQEAFLRAYRALARFRGESTFRTWITRIAINLAHDARLAHRATMPLEAARGLHASGDGGHEAALKGQVREAVLGLPPRQRQVLVLKVYEGMKFSEIAEAAGISIGTAKATFFQAVRGLRERLGAGLGGAEAGESEVGA